MIGWGEFKRRMEAAGVSDDDLVDIAEIELAFTGECPVAEQYEIMHWDFVVHVVTNTGVRLLSIHPDSEAVAFS